MQHNYVDPFPCQPIPLLSPFCRCSPNRLNCQRTPCFASTGFRNCNIHLTVCQERIQKLKVIDVEGAAIGIGAVYQALTKKMHNSRRPFSSWRSNAFLFKTLLFSRARVGSASE